MTVDLLFLGFSTNLILSCILTITAYNAVGALVALIFAFINTTCIFFLMELEFVGLLFLIVYVGAISVLFLFSVMLFNLKDVIRSKTTSFILKNLLMLIFIYIFFLFLFQFFIKLNYYSNNFLTSTLLNNEPENLLIAVNNLNFWESLNDCIYSDILPNNNSELYFLGQVLYNKFLLYLILTAVILLIAMIGAVVLINNPKEQIQMQHAVKQMTRNFGITNLK